MSSLLKLVRGGTREERAGLLSSEGAAVSKLSPYTHAQKEDEGEGGSLAGEFVKSLIFGGIDGIITTMSTLASSVGGSLSAQAVITLTLANLLADGLSMGLGDFLSSYAEMQHQVAERKREEWEMTHYPAGEQEEMVAILQEKGFEAKDARELIEIMSRPEHKEFFIDFMMTEELGLEVADDPYGPAKDGAVTFASFLVFGSVPLIVYAIMWGAKYQNQGVIFGLACIATAMALFALGALQGKITHASIWISGLYMTVNGSLACAAAYLVGWALQKAVETGNTCNK